MTRFARIGRAIRLAFWSFLFWTGLGLFFASQLVFAGLPWSVALSFSMPRWYTWGLLAPGVFWVDGRLGATLKSLGARVALHVPVGIACTCLSIVIRLVSRPLRGSPWPPNVWQFFLERFYWDLLIYAVIAGVSIARDYAARVRERDRQAHELALATADLERRLVEARLQSLRAQLHPHFLFNAFNTISAFTETNPQMARRLMGQLGDLLRASLTHASQPLVTLGEELTFLDGYLAIESARFEGRLTVSVHVDADRDPRRPALSSEAAGAPGTAALAGQRLAQRLSHCRNSKERSRIWQAVASRSRFVPSWRCRFPSPWRFQPLEATPIRTPIRAVRRVPKRSAHG